MPKVYKRKTSDDPYVLVQFRINESSFRELKKVCLELNITVQKFIIKMLSGRLEQISKQQQDEAYKND